MPHLTPTNLFYSKWKPRTSFMAIKEIIDLIRNFKPNPNGINRFMHAINQMFNLIWWILLTFELKTLFGYFCAISNMSSRWCTATLNTACKLRSECVLKYCVCLWLEQMWSVYNQSDNYRVAISSWSALWFIEEKNITIKPLKKSEWIKKK